MQDNKRDYSDTTLSTIRRRATLGLTAVGITAGLLLPMTVAHAATGAGSAAQSVAATPAAATATPATASRKGIVTLSSGQTVLVTTGSERALTAVERSKTNASAASSWWACWYDQKTITYGAPWTWVSYQLNVQWCGNGSVVTAYHEWISETVTWLGSNLWWSFQGVLNNNVNWGAGGRSVVAYTRGYFRKDMDPVWVYFPQIWILVDANGGHQEHAQA